MKLFIFSMTILLAYLFPATSLLIPLLAFLPGAAKGTAALLGISLWPFSALLLPVLHVVNFAAAFPAAILLIKYFKVGAHAPNLQGGRRWMKRGVGLFVISIVLAAAMHLLKFLVKVPGGSFDALLFLSDCLSAVSRAFIFFGVMVALSIELPRLNRSSNAQLLAKR